MVLLDGFSLGRTRGYWGSFTKGGLALKPVVECLIILIPSIKGSAQIDKGGNGGL